MKSVYRRLATILIVFILTGAVFFYARDYSASSGQAIYEKTLTIDVFDTLANYQGLQSGWFSQLVLDRFNIRLNIIAPNIAGGGDAMYQTRTAAGELGDLIICNGNNSTLQDLVSAGLLFDMSELLKDKDIMQYRTAIRALNDPISDTAVYAVPSEISRKTCLDHSESEEPI